jgi:hypothetical protein
MTRARVAQLIYTSVDPAGLDDGSILRAYLDHATECQKGIIVPQENTHRDRFLSEIKEALENLGCQTWIDYKIAGMQMDLVGSAWRPEFVVSIWLVTRDRTRQRFQ